MDSVRYGQLYHEAMGGMDTLFEDMQASLKGFKKKTYPEIFETMMRKYGKVFLCIEQIYQESEDGGKWLKKLAERFAGCAEVMIASEKRKFKRENLQMDCNMFVTTYVLPAILEYKGDMSEPFAETVRDCWNETFGTRLECGTYEHILGGFRTSIFGIPFGK